MAVACTASSKFAALKRYGHAKLAGSYTYIAIIATNSSVETRSGHLSQPGHILSGSSGPDSLSKISGSDPDSTMYHMRR